MTVNENPSAASGLVARLGAIAGLDHVIADAAEREYFSRDIFFWDGAAVAEVVVQPADADEVAAVVRAAHQAGCAVIPRGGGMSYTKGYVPDREGAVLLDLRRLDSIIDFNPQDMYVTVGAGCTWRKLSETIEGERFLPVITPPFSGIYSTVGGALSQNVPDGMDGVLGVEVVLGDGRIVRTGSGGRRDGASPFYRNYGPDLTGLFLGDTGAFGIKTRATLALRPAPAGEALASFAFDNFEDLAAASSTCGRLGVVTLGVGLDPVKNQSAARVSFGAGIKTIGGIAKSGPSLAGGVRQAAKAVKAGRHFLDGVAWSFHVVVEGVNQDAAEAGLELARQVCLKKGHEIANTLVAAMRSQPYSVRGFLGAEGERWVPTNAVLPHSKVVDAVRRTEEFFAERKERMEASSMKHSYITTVRTNYFLLEPSFYWPDEVSELHLRHLGEGDRRKFEGLAANPAARSLAKEIRQDLRDLFFELGAVNLQIAKFYRYKDALDPATWGLVRDLKQALDPDGVMNPANLGLDIRK
jgi:FAD/FMN-containing dehydrogenase